MEEIEREGRIRDGENRGIEKRLGCWETSEGEDRVAAEGMYISCLFKLLAIFRLLYAR